MIMNTNSWGRHLLVIALYSGLTLLFLNPLSWQLGGALADTVDPLLTTWISAWVVHALTTDPSRLFDANIFAPYPDALAYSETLLGSVLQIFPVTLATGLPVLNHNLIMVLGFVLGGYNAYLLGLAVTRSRLAAFLVGVIFIFNVYRLSLLPKVQMATLQWLPLVLYYLWRVAQHGRRHDAVLLALFLVLQVLTTVYYGVFTALMLLLLAPLFLLAYRRQWPRKVAAFALAALLSTLVIVPYALPYMRINRSLGLERTLIDAIPFAASLRQWGLVGTDNLLYGRWLSLAEPPMVGPYPIDYLFPGLLVLLLAALALIFARGGRLVWSAAALLLVVSSFVLSLGPELMVEPLQTVGDGVRLPYAWLHEHLPGFEALRAPARFAGFFMLGLGLLAGIALARLQRLGVKPIFLVGLVVLVFLESLSWPATTTVPIPQTDDIPPVYKWLTEQTPGSVVELPADLPQQHRLPDRWLWPQYYSIYHWRPTPTGYSGFVPPGHESLIDLLNHFPDPAVQPLFQALDVRFVLIHRPYFDDATWQGLRQQLAANPDLAEVWADESILVVKIGASQDPAVINSGQLFLPPSVPPDETYNLLLTLDLAPTGRVLPPGNLARGSIEWLQNGRVQHRRTFVTALPFLVEQRTALLLPTTAPAIAGDYDIVVRVTEPVEVEASSLVSVADRAPALQALPLSLQDIQLTCDAGTVTVQLRWSALGWTDTPQTVFLHLLDANGDKIAQIDVELNPPSHLWLLGMPMHTSHHLILSEPNTQPSSLLLGLYAWSDHFQTIIPGRFFDPQLTLVDMVTYELTEPLCLR
ncbi:MAG: hypothetical protein GY759_18030 [Chloroflexi bacterium]|nr:hypothetical protein [Chloroflexota bacterium]